MDEKLQRISDTVDASREQMLALWEALVNTDSPTTEKAGADAVARRLARELEGLGARVCFLENERRGDVLYAEWGAENPGKPVIFTGHMDTVFPPDETKRRPFTVENGLAFGPGVLDMKGGLVAAVYALRALHTLGYQSRPVRVIFAGDEESGHRQSGTKDILLRLAKGAAAAFNFETGFEDGGIVTNRKGCARFTLAVTGVEAHSGNAAHLGRSAIREMAHKILALEALSRPEEGLTVSVGTISGGTVVNAIPGFCKVEVDVRYLTTEQMESTLHEAKIISDTCYTDGCLCEMQVQENSIPMPQSEGNLRLFEAVARAAEKLGQQKLHPMGVGGWSDSNLIASLGIPVVCAMGVQGKGNHTQREYAVVESLFSRAKLAAAAVLELDIPGD